MEFDYIVNKFALVSFRTRIDTNMAVIVYIREEIADIISQLRGLQCESCL